MKKLFGALVAIAVASIAHADSVMLFAAFPITCQPGATNASGACYDNSPSLFPFGTATVYLVCNSGTQPSGTLSGADGGQFSVDNYLTVNGSNVCPGGGCIGGLLPGVPATWEELNNHIGKDAVGLYVPVGPIDVGTNLTLGSNEFRLIDSGGIYGSSDVYFTPGPNCAIPTGTKLTLCHVQPKKTPVTVNVSIDAVAAHQAHGDTVGECH